MNNREFKGVIYLFEIKFHELTVYQLGDNASVNKAISKKMEILNGDSTTENL